MVFQCKHAQNIQKETRKSLTVNIYCVLHKIQGCALSFLASMCNVGMLECLIAPFYVEQEDRKCISLPQSLFDQKWVWCFITKSLLSHFFINSQLLSLESMDKW